MPTDFVGIPSLVERIIAAELIAVAVPRRLVGVQPDDTAGTHRVFGTFELDVVRVMKGHAASDQILVRVIGEGEDGRAHWIVPIEEGRPMLWLLASDIRPELPADVYAPVFASAFRLEGETLDLPSESASELAKEIATSGEGRNSIRAFSELVQAVVRSREEQLRALQSIEGSGAVRAPYPPVEEMPQDARDVFPRVTEPSLYGGRSAEVDQSPGVSS